jgi:phosphopantothenoylcysteine decarboxylase / phosphopantothenate---cysteine ligase
MKAFAGKNILIGITGSIAAFKVAGWVSTLAKAEACVSVIMTESATRFVTPLTFSSLSGQAVHTDMFAGDSGESMTHINLGREADLIVVAPATAQSIARLAHGMASDLLSTTILAARAPVFICPAMNSRMYAHPATQENLGKLRIFGYTIIEPGEGMMACKEEGQGRLAEWDEVSGFLQRAVTPQDLEGRKILVTAGPTREPLDPARYLSNRSSGKMGYALARAAYQRGAVVTLISGPTSLSDPVGITTVKVQTAEQMHQAVLAEAETVDIIIKAAAVADYRPKNVFTEKVKKNQIANYLELVQNPDILLELGRRKRDNQILVGFAAESANLEAEGRTKLARKNLDLIAVNNINSESTGFEVDNNQVLLVDAAGSSTLPFASKAQTAHMILDKIVNLLNR